MDPSRKLIIQMSGPPGSGKSTLARLLARSIDGVVINHDLIKDFFLDSSFSFLDSARLTYRLDWALAEDMIQQGRSVVVDSVCNYEEVLTRGTALAERYGYTYWYVECKIEDADLLDRRLHARVPLRSQRTGVNGPPPDSTTTTDVTGTVEDGAALFRKWMDPRRPNNNNVLIVVDSTHGPEECLKTVMQRLGSWPAEQLQDDPDNHSVSAESLIDPQ
ncbi:P-loop containing nucleoside triphosphate hydrolase protein [Xylaria venustula]|nr:P-loop containing nucleoside triphosphate hydrolase protein [Xylaria venustula]